MPLVKTFDEYDLREEFKAYNRDYFSLEACRGIIEYFEDCHYGENVEVDIIGLCCDFSEEDFEEIAKNYDIDFKDEDGETDYSIDDVLDYLNAYTWAIETENDCILYINF